MRIVTVATGDQPFIHFVMEGLRKRRLHIGVAGVAEQRLRDFEQIYFALGSMRAVTVDACYLSLTVRRAFEIRMGSDMAGQTAGINFLGRSCLEDEDLGLVTAAGYVFGARPVAPFATLMGRAAFGVKRCLPVRRPRPFIVELFVTSLAGV